MLSAALLVVGCVAPAAQDEVEGRYGEFVRTIDGLAHPVDVAFGPGGRLLVLEMDTGRVLAMDVEGDAIGEVGLAAPAPRFPRFLDVEEGGAVRATRDVRAAAEADLGPGARAVDALDLGELGLAVTDAGRHRVRVGAVEFGDFGPYRGLLAEPWGLAFRDDRLYVADRENHRVQVFGPDGAYLYEWGRHPLEPYESDGALHYPTAVAISPAGEWAVVAEPLADRLSVFRRTERPAAEFMTNPALLSKGVPAHYGTSLHAAGQLMLVAEPESRRVLVFDMRKSTPIEIARVGTFGDRPATFATVGDVWLSADPWVAHVSDPSRRTIQTWFLDYEPAGELRMDPTLATFARELDLDAALAAQGFEDRVVPGALAEGPDERLYVADLGTPRIVVFDRASRRVATFGADLLQEPIELEFRGEELLVLDRTAGCVQAFALDGEPGERIELEGKVQRAAGMCVLPGGELLVTDAARHRVVDAWTGDARWSGQGLRAGETHKPGDLTVDGRGYVTLSDHGNHRLQVFDADGAFVAPLGPRLYTNPARRP